MSTLTAFKNLKKQQAAERREANREAKERHSENDRQCKIRYIKFKGQIKPFNKKTVNKRKITLEFKDKEYTVIMSVDGKPYVELFVRHEHQSCNCSSCADGQSLGEGHEGSHSYRLRAIYTPNVDDSEIYEPYFSWQDDITDESFAYEFDKFIEKYNSDVDWNHLKYKS